MPRDWGHYFPWPFVGAAVLLAVLIFLTPNLVASVGSPAAGSLATQAELVIDRVVDGNTTHFYVHSLGTVRYDYILVQLDTSVPWPPPPRSALNFTNESYEPSTLESLTSTTANPVAINVTAKYTDASGTQVWYFGTYALDIADGMLTIVPLLPGSSSIPATPVAQLPLTLYLTASPTSEIS